MVQYDYKTTLHWLLDFVNKIFFRKIGRKWKKTGLSVHDIAKLILIFDL